MEKIYKFNSVSLDTNDGVFDMLFGISSKDVLNMSQYNIEVISDQFLKSSSLKEIILPRNVKEIGDNFLSNSKVENIVLPKSLKKIGPGVLYGCRNLNDITIPSSVEEIREEFLKYSGVYYDETNWINNIFIKDNWALGIRNNESIINIPEGVKNISINFAYANTSYITEVTIPSSLLTLSKNSFNFCTNLTKLTIKNGIKIIKSYCFEYCPLLKEVDLPNSLEKIEYGCFDRCTALETLTFGSGIKELDGCFKYCTNLTSIVIPKSIKKISMMSFYGSTSLVSIRYDGSVLEWNTVEKTGWPDKYIPATYIQCTDGQVQI